MTNASSLSTPSLLPVFRRAASFIPSGVAILSTGNTTMTVSSLHCISLDPPRIGVALSRSSHKAASILNSGRFHIRLLRTGEESLAKGDGLPCGAGLVELECTIVATFPAGDHDFVLAEVGKVSISEGHPVVYWRRALHQFRPRYEFLVSREILEKFIAAWETGALPKAEWTHGAHVAVGAYYAVRYPSTALERTRSGILRYNAAVGTSNTSTSGYHETLTRLWALVLAKIVEGFTDPWEAASHAVEKLGEDRDLHCLYYSFDVVRSIEARRTWVPPDLEGPY